MPIFHLMALLLAMALPKTPFLSPCPSFSILLFLIFLALQTPLSFSADTISANSSISGDQQLTSKGGNFVLGFFSPPNSTKYYIGIWYKKVAQQTSVWVANRETPVSDRTNSELRLSNDGNLVLLNESKAQIWSTNATFSANSTVAVLQDTGNLVLADGSNSRILWQSIDHPTNTWLPGGKLGLNKVTKQNQRLISWKSSADPAPGIFSFELDPNGSSQSFIQWNKSVSYWSSGTWNGQIFSNIPEMTGNGISNFTYVNTINESYKTYSVKTDLLISGLIMDPSGQIHQWIWMEESQEWMLVWSQPRAQCEVYSLCGPFGSCSESGLPFCKCVKGFVARNQTEWELQDRTGGCVRNTPLQCGSNSSANVKKDKFYPMESMRLPENAQNQPDVGSAEDCESACLNNCSCTAYSFSAGCSLWYGDLINLQEQYSGSNGTLYLRLAASELPDSTSNKGKIAVAVAGAVASLIVCVVIVWLLIWMRRKRQMILAAEAVGRALVPFRYSHLQRFTKNFSEKLGRGGFGSVFKGFLPDSTAIAVKKLEGLRLHGEKQFRAEVRTIGMVQHVNLVQLLGFCSEGTKRLLVYEFMPKGSLDTQLFHKNSVVLDWNTRYQIALGVARGLAYLHEKCRDCIIHCDIKPENILLDASFVPKVADFGLAKLVGRDFSRVLTTMRGTRGYLAPEWIAGGAITAKADVYSYGMMLFEIMSGRRNLEQTDEGICTFFPILAANRLMQGEVQNLVDHRLEDDDVNIEELQIVYKVAYWCIQDDESSRPTMGQVVQTLEGFLEINMPPIPRSLQILVESLENINLFSDLASNQGSQTWSTNFTSSQVKSAASRSSNV